MKSVDVQSNQTHILSLAKKIMIKILNLKLLTFLEYQNIKMFLQKVTLQIGLKKFLWLKNFKTMYRGHMLLVILNAKKLLKHFTKNNCKKQIKKCLDLKKWYYM